MLNLLIQFSFSFFASAAYAILTNVPRRSLVACGLSGAIGWMLYWLSTQLGANAALGSLLGALSVAAVSFVCSRKLKLPVTIFNIPGMVPLVPGGLAYQAVRNVVIGNYETAIYSAVQAVMIAGAIALGLVLSEVLNHNIRNFREKRDIVSLIRKKEDKKH
ncbi:threonine/serine exporter family protein [Enterococcus sp. AZ126]|uniref:threonine/serine exporter family protein n=1 Tax=Enterococcus sp. AZ126 TaxID=2774635 RepID=UPI003F24C3DF